MSGLHPYMVFVGDPEDGAELVFAATAKKARTFGWQNTHGTLDDAEIIDVRARRMRRSDGIDPYLWADKEKMAAGEPHMADAPTCDSCEQWGEVQRDGEKCWRCRDQEED